MFTSRVPKQARSALPGNTLPCREGDLSVCLRGGREAVSACVYGAFRSLQQQRGNDVKEFVAMGFGACFCWGDALVCLSPVLHASVQGSLLPEANRWSEQGVPVCPRQTPVQRADTPALC